MLNSRWNTQWKIVSTLTVLIFTFEQILTATPLDIRQDLTQTQTAEISVAEVEISETSTPSIREDFSDNPLTLSPSNSTLAESTTIIGYLDSSDLNGIKGWAVDTANRSLVLDVEILVNGEVKVKRKANTSRPDLVAAGIAPDPNHGYNVSIKELALTAGTYQIQVQGVNPNTGDKKLLTNTKTLTISDTTFQAIGYLDSADWTTGIKGWAVSQTTPSVQLEVEILVNGEVKKTVKADQSRPDLVGARIAPDPYHGYSLSAQDLGLVPGTYSIQARAIDPITGVRKILTNTKTLTVPEPTFTALGYLDDADWSIGIKGWAVNQDNRGQQLEVEILVNGVVKKKILANQSRPDLVAAHIAPDPNHGFFINASDLGLAAGTYSIQVQAIDPATGNRRLLNNTKSLTVPQATFQVIGYLDYADSINGIKGWAVNKVNSGQQLEVEILVNGEVKKKVLANKPRPDLVAVGIAPDPNHGYSITLDELGLNPGTYTIQVRALDPQQTGPAQLLSNTKTLNIVAPTVQFTSSATSASSDYILKYKANGVEFQQNWHLAPGLNTLVIEVVNASIPYFFTFQVNHTAPPAALLTDLLNEDDSMHFNLDLTQMQTDAGELLSDLVGSTTAELLSANFDAQGNLTDGILKFEDGRAFQLIAGKIRQILDPSGTLYLYSSTAELESLIQPNGARSNFAVRLNSFSTRTLIASTASSASDVAFYDSESRLRYGKTNNEITRYEEGILRQIKTSSGAILNYEIKAISGGFESKLLGTVTDPNAPVLLRYSSDKKLTDVETSSGNKFNFQNGVLINVTNSAGEITQYSFEDSPLGDFIGFQISRAGVQRNYDEEGNLAKLITTEGVTAHIEGNSVSRVDLTNGEYATDLVFDSNGNVIEAKIHAADGSISHYINNALVDLELADHSLITFENGKARTLKTADGRTYKYIYALDGSGNETSQALRAELISYTSPAGNKLDLTDGSLTDFTLESQNPFDNFGGGTTPPATPTFIPLLNTPENIIRNLQLDANGKMISAEILNKSGDQYFIVNGNLDRIITLDGKVLTFENDSLQPPNPQPFPLTAEETAYKNQLIEQHLEYFKSGKGIDSVTGLPFDDIKEDGTPERFTQPTSIGFYLQILGAILDGSYSSSSITKQQALNSALLAANSLLTMQSQIGWNGLIPFANLTSPYTRFGNTIGFGDNANLAQSLAVLIGSAENAKLTSGLNISSLNTLISRAESFITNQSAGYSNFYDATSGLFRSSYNLSNGTFTGFNDRLMNEFRTSVAFVITRYNLPQKAWDNLITVTRYYQDQDFNPILNAVPFDGGAFQMFWPLLRADQELKPEMKAAVWNFLYSLSDYAVQNDLPGFPSASYDPIAKKYEGKIGVPELAETRDVLKDRTVSVYALASAYALAPQFVLSWLKAIQTQYPSIIGPYGFYDAMAMPDPNTIGSPVVGQRVYAIDQGSFLLGLINNAGTAFNKYLDTRGFHTQFDQLYDRLQLNITPVEENLFLSPFGTERLLSVAPPQGPPSGFHITQITNPNGEVKFEYLLSPQSALSNVKVQYQQDGIQRSSDLLTYFEQTKNFDEINYLLNQAPINLFNQNVEQGAVFTPGKGSSIESRVQDEDKGFVKAFDYQLVPNGDPVGYYAKFNNLDLSDVDFLTFSVRRDLASVGPQSLEVKLEGLGETFIIDSIPTSWTRVVLPLKKPNTNLSRVAILIHDLVSENQSGRVYLGDISLFSLKNYTPTSWESSIGLTKTQIEDLAEEYLSGGNQPPPVNTKTKLSELTLSEEGNINSAKVEAKNGAILFIQDGKVSKVVTPSGKTILYKDGNAETVTDLTGDSAAFSYARDFKGDIQEIILTEAGIQRVFDTEGKLDRLIFRGLSGGIDEGILTSLRTRFESITDLVGDEFGHIKNAKISLNDGRVLMIENYKLVKTILLSGTEVSYDGEGLVTSILSKAGLSEYLYQKDVTEKITRVDVRYTKNGQLVTENLVPFLRDENRIEEAVILLETPLINLTEIASNIGAFFEQGKGTVTESEITDPLRNDVIRVDYNVPANATFMGIYFRFPNVDLSKYEIMNVSLKGEGSAQPSLTLELKGQGNDRIQLSNITNTWTDNNIPIDNINTSIFEVTLLIDPSKILSGTFYLDDISFFNIRKINAQSWQDQLSFDPSDLEQFAFEITQPPLVDPLLYQVDVPVFQELRDFSNLPIVLNLDSTGKIQSFSRGDGAQIAVTANVPTSVQLSNGQVISYEVDTTNQQITSSTITNTETQTSTSTEYAYGRAREITLEDGKKLEYHYEFDAQGNEVTVVNDTDTGEVKKFVNGMIKSSDSNGLITTYTFDESGQLTQSNLSFQGKSSLDLTQYERRGDKTFITDRSGITWIYDANGILIQHRTPDGLLYQHTTATDEHGQLQRLIFLMEKTTEDGTTIYYENAEISRIVFANGVSFINPQYDENHNLSGAKVLYEDGSEVDYVNQFAVKVTNLFGDVTTYALPPGKIFLESNSLGKVEFIRIERDGLILRYNREGDLVNLTTADDTLYQYVYEEQDGIKTGRMKIYRRELAQVAGVPIPFPLSADVDTFGKIHVLVHGIPIYTADNLVRVIALNPQDGSIDTSASFNMALTGMGKAVSDFIDAIPDGEYVLVIYPPTSTGYSTDSGNFMNALEKIGGDRTKSYLATKPWMLLGQKGIQPGQVYDDFKSYDFNGITVRLDTEKRDVFYLDQNKQIISPSDFGFPSTLLDTSRHGNYISEMTEVFGTITKGSNTYAAAYFKNFNINYPESGLYRFWGDFEDRNFIEKPASYLDEQLGSLVNLASGFREKAIYFDERYPVRGISINNLRALKGYLVSKGFRVLNADQLKSWLLEKSADSFVLMAQDIAPDTIVDINASGLQLPREYVERGGSFVWLYDTPFYEIGHANNTTTLWGSQGDNFGLRAIFGISVAYETTGKVVDFYNVTPSESLDPIALSQTLHLDFDIQELDTWQNIKTTYEKSIPAPETDIASIYDQNGVVLGVRKADGTQNVFEGGKLKSILNRQGIHLIDYIYNSLGELVATDYVHSRQELAKQIENAELQVAQLKTKALMQVATNRAIGIQDIQNQLIAARESLASARSQVESQRYVTQCRQCGCSQCCDQVENPGYRQALANIAEAEHQAETDAAAALASIDTEVAKANQQIASDQDDSIAKIREKQNEVLRSVIQNEITPVLMQFYRLLLGRDPSTTEMNRWLDEAVNHPQSRVNVDALKTELLNSSERAQRLSEIALIKSDVRAFLDAYVTDSQSVRVSKAASLGLLADEIVSLSADEVNKIMAFLDNQNLHFGYSAFLPLQAFLKQNNLTASTRTIAVKTILIDILVGNIHPFSEDNLKISLFALERTSKVLGAAPKGAKLTFEELKSIYAANPNLKTVIHLKNNHYVTLVSVSEDKVSYIESAMGNAQIPGMNAQGEVVELSKEQFLELWLNPLLNTPGDSAAEMGVVLLPEQVQVANERILDTGIAKLIQGADCGITLLITIVVSALISGTVQAITASDGNFVTNFLKGFAFGAITGAVTFGIGAVLSGFASAVTNVAGNILNGIKSFVSPIINGFKVVGNAVGNFISKVLPTSVEHFLGGVGSWIGRGIDAVKTFASNVMKVTTDGFKSLKNYVQTATGIKKVVVETLLAVAVDYGTNKGLTLLGVNPEIAMLASAFVTGGFLGALNSGSTVTGVRQGVGETIGASITVSSPTNIGASFAEGFVIGGVKSLALASLPQITPILNLSPNLNNVLRITSSALLGSGGNVTNDILKGLGKDLAKEFSITGVNALGNRLGLDPRVTALAGIPIRSTLTGLVDALTNSNGGGGPGGIFSAIKNSLLSRETLGGFVSVGAEFSFEQINAPEIIKGVGGILISGFIDGLIPTQNIPDQQIGQPIQGIQSHRKGIIAGIADALNKAAVDIHGTLVGTSQFGQLLNQVGLAEALNILVGISLQRSTIENIIQVSNNLLDYLKDRFQNKSTIIDFNGRPSREVTFGEGDNQVVMIFDQETNNLMRIEESGRILEGDLRLGANGQPYVFDGYELSIESNGTARHSVYKNGKLVLYQDVREGQSFDYYAEEGNELRILNGVLENGILENVTTGEIHIVRNGKLVEIVKEVNFTGIDFDTTTDSDVNSFGEVRFFLDENGQVIDANYSLNDLDTSAFFDEDIQDISSELNGAIDFGESFDGTPAGLALQFQKAVTEYQERYFDLFGQPSLTNPNSVVFLLASESLKGMVEFGKLGMDFFTIKSAFEQAKADGEFELAIKNYIESFKAELLAGRNPLIGAGFFSVDTPNLNVAFTGVAAEGFRVIDAVTTIIGIGTLLKAGATMVDDGFRAFSQFLPDLSSETGSIPLSDKKHWLDFWEGKGIGKSRGHVIEDHVQKSDAQLLQRLNEHPNLPAASTFTNKEVAGDVISTAINQNRAQIEAWLRNPSASSKIQLDYIGNEVIGRGVQKSGVVGNRTNAIVVLKKKNNKYYILTAYPTL